MKTGIVMMLLMGLAAGTVQAALIAYEPFEGVDGTDVDTTTGGTGWTGAWSDTRGAATQFVFSDPGLTFGGLETSGLKATYLGNGAGGNTRYSRSLGSAITVDASNPELWASYVLDLNETQAGRGCGVELTNGGSPVVGFGKGINRALAIGEGDDLGVGSAALNVAPVVAKSGATFFVLKLAFDGADTVATVYAAKGTETGFDISDVGTFGGSATITLSGPITIDGVNLFGYHGSTATNSVDDIRIGDSYGDFFETDLANTPIPGNNDSDVSLATDLEWQPPTPSTYIATGYDVWFGTEPNELDPARDMTQIAVKQAATAVLNADLVTEWGAGLVNGQKYYWQVDAYEPNVLGDTLHPGDLWNFTAIPPNVIINDDPVSVTVAAGDEAVFTVNAANAAGYLWYKSTDAVTYTELSGETSQSLTLSNVQQEHEGWYFCHVDGIEPQDSTAARLMTERLLGHWTFDNTLDAAVGGLTATAVDPNEDNAIAPSVGYGTDGDAMIGMGSLSLDNSEISEGGWLSVPGSEQLYNFYPQGLTISTWIKTTVSGYDEIVSKNYDDGASRFFHRLAGSNGLFRFGSAGAWTNGAINDGDWHLMVTTYDPATKTTQVYLDGEPRGSASMSPTSEGNLAPITIGGSALPNATKDSAWNGFIDDVKIYTYALTTEAIAQEYFDVTGVASCIYEFDGAAFDVNNDCVVNMADMAMVAQYWLDSGLYPPI